MTQYEKLNFVNGSPPALNAATLNHMEDGIAAATEGVTALDEELDNLLSQKYDSSNIETGIGSLTPSSNSKDVIQSADFKYQRIGNKVTIGISITFIAGEYREIELIKLPFVCQNKDLRGICVTNTNRKFIWKIYDAWLTSSSYLRISRTDSYNFSNNEELNFTFSYFIKT